MASRSLFSNSDCPSTMPRTIKPKDFGNERQAAVSLHYHSSAWPLRVQDDFSSFPDVLMDVSEYRIPKKASCRVCANGLRYRVFMERIGPGAVHDREQTDFGLFKCDAQGGDTRPSPEFRC